MNTEKNNKEGIDLSGRFKDSEAKLQGRQEELVQVFRPGTPKIIQWVIKYSGGLIKNEKQASYLILGFVILAIIISLSLIFRGGGLKTQEPTGRVIEEAGSPADITP